MPDRDKSEVLLKQRKVLADFGDVALQSEDLYAVLHEACRLVGEALGTGRAKVLEIEPGGHSLFLRAGVGWAPDVVGQVRLALEEHSSETYAIKAAEPVLTQDIAREERFEVPPFMKEAGVVALVNVPIFRPGKTAYGLLQVDDTRPRDFDQDDIEFLRTYATLLGPIIDRLLRLQDLHASEERFRAAVEAATDYAIFTTDAEGRIVIWPKGAEEVFGWTAVEAVGQPLDMTFTPEDRAAGQPDKERREAREKGQAPDVRWHQRKDGSQVFVDGMMRPLTGPDGTVTGFVKAGQDMTERRATEEALRASEERFRAIVETATDYAIFTTDPEGLITTWPQGAKEVFGWTVEEALGWPVDMTFTPEDRAIGAPETERITARTTGHAPDVRWHMRRDGSRVFIDGVTRPLTEPDGTLAGFVKVGQDVTEQRRAEERLQLATEAAALGIFDVDLTTGAIGWDARMRDLWGAAPDEVITDATFMAGIHPEDRELVQAALGQALDPGGRHLYRAEYRVLHRGTGRLCWITALGRVHFDGPRPARLVGVVQDVTERRRAEAALRESEERFRALAEQVVVGVGMIDRNRRLLYANEAFSQIVGHPRDGVVGRTVEELTAPEDWPHNKQLLDRMLSLGEPFVIEKRYTRPDGTQVWVRNSVSARRDGAGEIAGGIAISMDVTDRKAAEEALRESEARFRQFGDASADVLWVRNAETLEFEYVSPAFEEVYGHKLTHILDHNHVRRWVDLIVPEDRALALDHLRRVRAGEHVLNAFRILRGDGQIRWIRDTGFPILDEDGRVQRVAGIGHDATEQVELQDRLQVLVAELQHRSRNLVGVVQGVTERTLATSETLEEFRTRIRSRLGALGRVNGLLSRLEEGDRITFDQLLETEMQAHGVLGFDGQGEQVALRGPKGIRLRTATVQTFALAIHELATNALKYGALSRPEGRLQVKWSLIPGKDGDRRLRVDWRESGVPVPDPEASSLNGTPVERRQGYGRELIERALPYQLRAETSYELTPEGVRCLIIVPVSSTLDLAFSSQGEPDA